MNRPAFDASDATHIAIDLGDGTAWAQRTGLRSASDSPLQPIERAVLIIQSQLDAERAETARLRAQVAELQEDNAAMRMHFVPHEAAREAERLRAVVAELRAACEGLLHAESSTDPKVWSKALDAAGAALSRAGGDEGVTP